MLEQNSEVGLDSKSAEDIGSYSRNILDHRIETYSYQPFQTQNVYFTQSVYR